MREILFRAKRVDNGAWVEGYYSELTTPSLGCMFMAGSDEYITCEDTRSYIIEIITKQHPYFSSANPMQVVELEKYEVIPKTVGEYTGLCDKNGKRIFEGDIVKECEPIYNSDYVIFEGDIVKECDLVYKDYETVRENLFTVYFDNGEFGVINEMTKCEYFLSQLKGGIEIIGNIHDNPELVEVSE